MTKSTTHVYLLNIFLLEKEGDFLLISLIQYVGIADLYTLGAI